MNIEYKNNYAIFNGERFKKDNKTGYYLKLSTSENIYLVESTMVDDLTFDEIFFAKRLFYQR